MLKLAAAAAVAAALASPVRSAHAECAAARYFGTPSETTIPRIGSLYLYDQSAQWAGAEPLPVVVKFIGRPGAFNLVHQGDSAVVRLDYLGLDGGTLDVTLGDDAAHAVYHLDSGWQREPAPRVLQFWLDGRDPELSSGYSDAVMIQIDGPVAAVDAAWTFDGVTTRWLSVPVTVEDFVGVSVVTLGDIACGVHDLDMHELHAGGHLALTAIRFDGSRVAIHGLPDRLAEDGMPVDSDGISHALKRDLGVRRAAPASPPIASPLPADWNPLRGLDDALYAALGGGAALVFACIVFLRLRPQLRDPNGTP